MTYTRCPNCGDNAGFCYEPWACPMDDRPESPEVGDENTVRSITPPSSFGTVRKPFEPDLAQDYPR